MMMQLKIKNIKKENFIVYALFIVSIVFFMRVMMDLTWFEDELRGYWVIKRLILSSLLSVGYLFQLNKIKSIMPRISKLVLIATILLSILWPIIGSPQTKVIFVILFILIFLKNKPIPNEQN